MRRNCAEALERWHNGVASPPSKQGGSVWTNGETIFSYGTALVIRARGKVILNRTRYSVTTTIHQNALAVALHWDQTVEGIPRGPESADAMWREAQAAA